MHGETDEFLVCTECDTVWTEGEPVAGPPFLILEEHLAKFGKEGLWKHLDRLDREDIAITLSRDQAMVLSDWLNRQQPREEFQRLVDDRAVWSALQQITETLDGRLEEIFDRSYPHRLAMAQERLKSELGDFGLPES